MLTIKKYKYKILNRKVSGLSMSDENKEKVLNQAEEVKKETIETAKKIKESVKSVDLKEETRKTQGFVAEMFKNPINKIEEMATEDTKYFKTAIFILIVWILAVFIKSSYSTFYYFGLERVFSNIVDVLKDVLVPAIIVTAYSLILFVFNKKEKKSLTGIISTVTATQLPLVIAGLISILTIISKDFSKISIVFNVLCLTITVVLSFFGFKAILNEKDNGKFIKKFVLIQVIYYTIAIVLTFLGIYIY